MKKFKKIIQEGNGLAANAALETAALETTGMSHRTFKKQNAITSSTKVSTKQKNHSYK